MRVMAFVLVLLLACPAQAFTLAKRSEDANAWFFNYRLDLPKAKLTVHRIETNYNTFIVTASKKQFTDVTQAKAWADALAGQREKAMSK